MAKKATLHPYSDQLSFDRVLILIATLIQYPGIGCPDESENGPHNALQEVQEKMRSLASRLEINFPEGYPAIATIRKDLETLRKYKILDQSMYRWGYYVGMGINQEEFKVAFNALLSQAQYQHNPLAKHLYQKLEKRLRALNLDLKGELFYPVYQQLNRSIVDTDPDEIIRKKKIAPNTLFGQLPLVEDAILQGHAIEVHRPQDFYDQKREGFSQIWPLQFIYHDIAWYLIYEVCETGLLAVGRVNRFSNNCKTLEPRRDLEVQKTRLNTAHQLLKNGWGLNLGNLEQQQQELNGTLSLELIKVRFYHPVTRFILEGENRHINQKVFSYPKKAENEDITHVDYQIKLPPRSRREFMLWVNKHLDKAQVLAPPELVEEHRKAAQALLDRYQS